MALIDYAPTVKGALNRAGLVALSTLLQAIGFGDLVRRQRVALRGKTPEAAASNKYAIAASQVITLPDDCKASQITRAYARTGTGTKGPLTVVAADATDTEPGAANVSITPSGDIQFAAADAYLKVDVEYLPEHGDVEEITMSATAADTFTLPAALAGRVVRMIEAESLAGTLVSKMIVLKPVDAKPATTKAALQLSKLVVQFAVADAVTSARFKFITTSRIDVNAKLAETSPTP